MKKIVLLVDTLSFGGSERTVQILANNQDYSENKFIIVSLADVLKYKLNDNVIRKTVYSKNFHALIKAFLLPITFIRIVFVLKNCKADAVISFHQQSHVLNVLASKILKYKSVVSERAYIESYYGRKNTVLKPVINFIYNKADMIIVNDIEIKESLIRYYKVKATIRVINNLLDTLNFEKKFIKAKQKSNSIKFITIGRLSKEKNTKDIIYAFQKANIENSTLQIIGNGPLLESLMALCKKLSIEDKVIFHGHQKEVGKFLNGADIFVFSSLNEGFPNVVLEAMYFELPIISYKFKAGITTILNDGIFGVLVPLRSVDKLAYEMKRMSLDAKRRSEFEKLSLKRVKYFTDKEKYIKQYNNVFKDVINE